MSRKVGDGCTFRQRDLKEAIKAARAAVKGPFSFMKGKMPRYLTLEEHMALGVHIAWFPGFTHHVLWAARASSSAAMARS